MRFFAAITDALHAQRGHLFPWIPVFLGAGIVGYFALRSEPSVLHFASLAAAAVGFSCLGAQRRPFAFLFWAPAFAAAGFCLAGARAHWVSAPVLDFRYYGPVEGRVVFIDRSPTNALRLTLDQVRLDRVMENRTPRRVRISLKDEGAVPPPGAFVMTTAHLLPPQGPVEPGGFDFRRHAWFKELGGLGYTRVPVLLAQAPGQDMPIERLRRNLAEVLQSRISGDTGGFAAAITAGDRSGVGEQTMQNLRQSNLAHLLAISGLHMGLLTGFVFGSLRGLLCLFPFLALRLPVKKLAALGALAAGAGYLLLSGGNVATERAYIMVAVMLGAVLLNRRAITLRAVAVAAVIVLLRRPESLLSPGFQMSFAATAALVAVFAALRDNEVPLGARWLRPVSTLVISSAVAGAATASFAAAHFNTVPHYGLLANLMAVPVMGVLVIPAAVLALCLSPFGLEWIGFSLMQLGLDWILLVARTVSGFDGAVSYVPSPGPAVLPMLATGLLLMVIWQGKLRLAGLAPACVALAVWSFAERPEVLIADSGGLVGVMEPEGRALSRAKGQGFTAKVWLENDGDAAAQPEAAGRWSSDVFGLPVWRGQGTRLIHAPGKRKLALITHCEKGDIVVSNLPVENLPGCVLLTPEVLRQTGSLSFSEDGGLATAHQISGNRLWTGWQLEGPEVARLRSLFGNAKGIQ